MLRFRYYCVEIEYVELGKKCPYGSMGSPTHGQPLPYGLSMTTSIITYSSFHIFMHLHFYFGHAPICLSTFKLNDNAV